MKILKSLTGKRLVLGAAVAAPLLALAAPALATHSWSTYHWKRTSNAELTIPVGDNVNATWDAYLVQAVNDWNQSTVIQSPLVAGSSNRNCRAVAGTIQVCNGAYGNTGWLGIASISLSGGHISQGTTKLNDTYFNTATYNTPAWRALVTCQEVGHDYGLDHQDENFNNANLNTCMDYTNSPASNQHPNAHDYEQLLTIYNHLETAAAVPQAAAAVESGSTPAEWGRATHFLKDGRPHVFERIDGPGQKTITHVFWAVGEGPRGNR